MYKIRTCKIAPSGEISTSVMIYGLTSFDSAAAWLTVFKRNIDHNISSENISPIKDGSFSIFEPANAEGFRQVVKIFYISLY